MTAVQIPRARALPVSPEITDVTIAFDRAIAAAIEEARAKGMPQGLIVAILHARDHAETSIMARGDA